MLLLQQDGVFFTTSTTLLCCMVDDLENYDPEKPISIELAWWL